MRLGKVLLVATVSALIPLAGKVIETFLTEQTSAKSWLVVPAVGVAVAMVAALVEAFSSSKERGDTPLVIALVVSVIVIGLGGVLASEATRQATRSIKKSTDKHSGTGEQSLARFVLTKADLREGYTAQRRVHASSVNSCARRIDHGTSTRSIRIKLTELGLKSCLFTKFRQIVRMGTQIRYNSSAVKAFLMRDEQAASKLLSVLRSDLLARYTITGAGPVSRHSVPAEDLGDEAPRGLTFAALSSRGDNFRVWAYLWRRGNIAAWVGSTNRLGDFDRLSTLELARRVDARGAG